MIVPPIRTALAVAILAVPAAVHPDAQPVGQALPSGSIAMPRVSGAAWIGGGALLLTGQDRNAVAVIRDALPLLRAGRVDAAHLEPLGKALEGQVDLLDLEDAAWDGKRHAYLVTSHSRAPGGDAPESRYRLARLTFDASGRLLQAKQTDALLQAIVNGIPFLADSIRRTPARTGLNIEGLAWDPAGQLVVGLRAPTVTESRVRPRGGQEDAVVLRVLNPDGLFQDPHQPAQLAEVIKLDLNGQGVRGMTYDPERRAFLLLSGLSAEPNHPVHSPWALWSWDGGAEAKQVPLPDSGMDEPAAICAVQEEGRSRLLILESGQTTSRFRLVPK